MFSDFEGRTEQEAIEKAIEELKLDRDDFDVEVLENTKKGLFKKSYVRIRVYYGEEESSEEEDDVRSSGYEASEGSLDPENDNEKSVLGFIDTLISKMGYEGKSSISFRRESKIGINIESNDSSIIIGRKGKNLDAIQLIANVYAGNLDPDMKVVIDSENYRMRHEEQIIRSAYKTAETVKRTGRSKLLDPMNPFERRLVHTALNDFEGVDTKSEGEGLYKQVRIIPVKNN
ncbi:MAG: RNA-binding cell elongation regulator Jag/EloR [Candidatus Ornithospirochaeta sp.]|nr:RNA-binding cell elongation regulator Jag/EloR [Candidatus Ornithospirochaeta sp.]